MSSFDAPSSSANWGRWQRWNKSYPGILKEMCRSSVFFRIQSFEEKFSGRTYHTKSMLFWHYEDSKHFFHLPNSWRHKEKSSMTNEIRWCFWKCSPPKWIRSVACSSTADASLRTCRAQKSPSAMGDVDTDPLQIKNETWIQMSCQVS